MSEKLGAVIEMIDKMAGFCLEISREVRDVQRESDKERQREMAEKVLNDIPSKISKILEMSPENIIVLINEKIDEELMDRIANEVEKILQGFKATATYSILVLLDIVLSDTRNNQEKFQKMLLCFPSEVKFQKLH